MFLTKKGLWKIIIVAVCYLISGSICIGAAVLLTSLGLDGGLLYVLGAICYVLCPLLILLGRYAEGKSKLLQAGNRLVRTELKPAEFIKQYEALKDSEDLIFSKPDFDVLHMLAVAYDTLNERERTLAVVDEMITVAKEKKKTFAKLIKVSYLFSYGRVEEAEQMFDELRRQKLTPLCNLMADQILKSDRAMAMGDYQTVAAHCQRLLEQSFPKPDPLGKVILHFTLGEAYEKQQEPQKAVSHYRYCADRGGETAIRSAANEALERLGKTDTWFSE